MFVNKISSNNNVKLQGVKFFPKNTKEWEPRILDAVLDSLLVKKAIAENESKGLDSLIYSSYKQRNSKHIFEVGVVKLKESVENFCYRIETREKLFGVESVIDFLKSKDAELNISKKMKEFNSFVLSLSKK